MLEAGQIINQRYQLEDQLGNNPIRVTWLASDLTNNVHVVVKLLTFGGNVQWNELKLFEREAQILKQLQHPRIPQYRDYFSIDARALWFGLVQEYIPGSNLKELLTKGNRFSEGEIKQYAKEILEILRYLHELTPPVYHRDIKPSNLILGNDGKVYLVDFGAVQDKATSEGVTFTVVGTYGYAPMEQFSGKSSPATDLYALGASLIHLLTGIAPADLPTRKLKLQFRDLIKCDSALLDWLEKMTEPVPENRFSTAVMALKGLEKPENFQNKVYSYSGQNDKLQLPSGTRVKVESYPHKIVVTIPAKNNVVLPDKILIWVVLLILAIPVMAIIWYGVPAFILLSIFIGSGFLNSLIQEAFTTKILQIEAHKQIIQQSLIGKREITGFGDYTDFIQDISVKYISQSDRSEVGQCLVIIIKHPSVDRIQKYYFGNGLTEGELLWLVQVLRQWLNKNNS